jgi:hypothetical protein
MVWKKIVRITAVSACPKCGNSGFDLEPGEDMDDLDALVRCGRCGHVCASGKFLRPVHPEHQPEPRRINQTIDFPDGSGKLVLFDWSLNPKARLENLVLLDTAGMFVWAAQLPEGTSPDCFVNVKVDDGGTLSANTWSSYLVTLDQRTGKILNQQFVK